MGLALCVSPAVVILLLKFGVQLSTIGPVRVLLAMGFVFSVVGLILTHSVLRQIPEYRPARIVAIVSIALGYPMALFALLALGLSAFLVYVPPTQPPGDFKVEEGAGESAKP